MIRAACFFLLLVVGQTKAQPYRVQVTDLSSQWQTWQNNQWISWSNEDEITRQICFSVDAVSQRGNYLAIAGVAPFSLWCNGRLVGNYKGEAILSLDSLARVYSSTLGFCVYGRGASFAKTSLVRLSAVPVVEELKLREEPFFLNFSIVVAFLLGVYFLILYQSNPRLTLDYFNFIKLFSVQERDESVGAARVTSSINPVIYLFSGLWISFLLLVVFRFTSSHWIVANLFSFSSVSGGLLRWLELAFLVWAALLLKVILILVMVQLFKFREAFGLQVLNFFRLVVFVAVLFSLAIMIYFMSDVTNPRFFNLLIYLLGWVVSGWFLLVFFKLMAKSPFSAFHLFSYLCATEIFPLVIYYEALFF